MPYTDIYLYSPLSIKTVTQGHNHTLLLQFILSELLHTMDADKKDDPLEFVFSSPACFFPYDWSYEVGCLNKISEHAQLLEHAFPDLQDASNAFNHSLDQVLTKVIARKKRKETIPSHELLSDLNQLYILLEPFLIACNQSESLLLFLLQNGDQIDQLTHSGSLTELLKKMHTSGSDAIAHLMQREYKNRGFNSIIPEIDRLLACHEQ